MIKLTQDNHDKLRVEIGTSELTIELRKFFGWRKDITFDRLLKQGSHKYDAFIRYLSEQGY